MSPEGATLADWLALHRISALDCAALLELPVPSAQADPVAAPLQADVSWHQVTTALAESFPNRAEEIRAAARATRFLADPVRSLTLHDDGSGRPLVLCRLTGDLSDLLAMAHEFGHAVQIIASAGRFMPPVLREICAYLAELAVIGQLDPDLASRAQALFLHRIGTRHEAQKTKLRQALADQDTGYRYVWNHVLARGLALHLYPRLSEPARWELYQGRCDLPALIGS